MMPKIYYSVEDGQEIMLEKFYNFPEAVRYAEQTEEAKEIFAFKEDGGNHELIGSCWMRGNKDNKDNKGTPE